MCNAGIDSKQSEELITCKSGGSDSPKLRTASARSGGTHFATSWTVSSAIPSAIKLEIASSRRPHRYRASDRRCAAQLARWRNSLLSSISVNPADAFSHSPAISGSTTECSGPYRGIRAPIRPSDHNQIASPGSFLIFAINSWPSEARMVRLQVLKIRKQAPLLILELAVDALSLAPRRARMVPIERKLLAGMDAASDPTQQHQHSYLTLQIIYKGKVA